MLENTLKVSTSQFVRRIVESVQITMHNGVKGLPLLALGQPGCGKSAAFHTAAKILESVLGQSVYVLDLRVMLYDPTELAGIKTIDQASDFAKALFPDWARDIPRDAVVLIVFEEATKAPMSTQNALLQLVLDRRAGRFEFGDNWFPFLTGNLQSSRSGDIAPPSPIRNRVASYIVQNTPEQWLKNYANENNVHPYVTTFVKANATDLPTMTNWSGEDNPLAFVSERSLTTFADVCMAADSGKVDTVKDWSISLLGEEYGLRMNTHVDLCEKLPDIDEIKRSPKTAPIIDEIGLGYYAAHMVAYWADADSMDAICTYARRLQHEIATTLVSEVARRHPECIETRAYIDFKCEYQLT